MDSKEIILLIGDKEFKCDKAKLVAASDYFKAMFSENFNEHSMSTIKLQDVDPVDFNIIHHFITDGSFSLSSDNVFTLLQISSMLQFTFIQSACEQYLLESLKIENCLEIYCNTSLLGLQTLIQATQTYILWNFSFVISSSFFVRLELNDLYNFLKNPALNTGPEGEWKVWEAINIWILEDEAGRQKHIIKLLEAIDYNSMHVADIENMSFYSVVEESEESLFLLDCIKHKKFQNHFNLHSENKNRVDEKLSVFNTEIQSKVSRLLSWTRKLSFYPCVIGFLQCNKHIGGQKKAKLSDDEGDCDVYIERTAFQPVAYLFDVGQRKISVEIMLSKMNEGPVHCSGYRALAVGIVIYITGGEFMLGYSNWNNEVWSYNTVSRKWSIDTILPSCRRHHLTCTLNSVIYLIGGFGQHRVILNTVDAYDTETGSWRNCARMPEPVASGAACAFHGRLFVFVHNTQVLIYYPETDVWHHVSIHSSHSLGYRAALAGPNCIFLIGNSSYKVFKYYPDTDDKTCEIAMFSAPPVNVCLVNNKLFSFSCCDKDEGHIIEVVDVNECDSCVLSKEVYREDSTGKNFFTKDYPADNAFCYGCFALYK